jgi:hypothetical protein
VIGPRILVCVELERSRPLIVIDCDSFEDWLRVRDWVESHPGLRDLVGDAFDLADAREAA